MRTGFLPHKGAVRFAHSRVRVLLAGDWRMDKRHGKGKQYEEVVRVAARRKRLLRQFSLVIFVGDAERRHVRR